jgi:uncharacterized membrane protein YvbJ
MYCGKCGSQVEDQARFCGHCGAHVSDLSSTAAAGTDTTHISSTLDSGEPKTRGMSCFNKGALVLILAFGACALFSVNSQMFEDQ